MASSGERDVRVVGADGPRRCRLAWEQLPDRNFRLTLETSAGDVGVVGRDLFHALECLRLLLEPQGLAVAVNGARADAWASGMQRDMTGARRVYLYRNGHHVTAADLVDVFGDADPADLATVAAQHENYRRWRESLSRPQRPGPGRAD